VKLEDMPAKYGLAPPRLAEHTCEVLRELESGDDEIEALAGGRSAAAST
jgi:hypothetical protein